MATRERTRDRAHELADRLLATAGSEIRMSRRAAGLSLRAAGGAVGLDHATLSRLERHGLEHVTVRQLALACAAVGLDLSIRAFPAGDAVRDAGHLRLLARFRARLPAGLELATEVPLPIPGDRRALDGWLRLLDGTMGVEAETRLADLQAAERKALQKQRDAHLDRMVLLVADSRGNRSVLEQHREDLRGSFPLDTRAILAAVGAGRLPSANGILVL